MSATSSIQPDECNVFINIWVDVEAMISDQTVGFYMVDNQSLATIPSTNEGTPTLNTQVSEGQKVCWTIQPIDPQFNGTLSITNIDQGEFGFSSPPGSYNSNPAVWTGQMIQNGQPGLIQQSITCSSPWNGGTTTTLTPTINLNN